MSNKWIGVKILAAPYYLEMLSGFLFALGTQGIEEGENHFIVYFDEQKWNQDVYWALLKFLTEVIPDFDESRLLIENREEENWLEKWKQSFKPFTIGQRLLIIPDWEKNVAAKDKIVLRIAPKMAFGTGHHETTRLCLQLMEKYLKPDMRFLDAGTGSGILSIFAAQLGAREIIGIDNDPIAIENAKENAQLNKVQEQVSFKVADVTQLANKTFDCIVANINRNVLLNMAGRFDRILRNRGLLIVSGILKSDQPIIEKAYTAQHLHVIDKKTLNEWLALVFEKRN